MNGKKAKALRKLARERLAPAHDMPEDTRYTVDLTGTRRQVIMTPCHRYAYKIAKAVTAKGTPARGTGAYHYRGTDD